MKVAEEFRRKLRELKLDVISEIQKHFTDDSVRTLSANIHCYADAHMDYYIMRVDRERGYIENDRGQDVGKTELFIDMPIDTLLDLLEAVETGKLIVEDQS